MRPTSIVRFEQLYLGALAIGLVNTIMTWSSLEATLAADPNTARLGSGFLIGTIAISLLISLALWFFTARKRSNVAKWILVVFFAIGVVSTIWSVANGAFPQGVQGALGALGFALQAASVYFLLRPESNRWFAHGGEDLGGTFR